MNKLFASLVILAACGGGGGSSDGPGADAPVAPAMITISGTASARGLGGATPVDGATVAAYSAGNDATPIAMTTTDASGNFSLVVMTTAGQAINGYLKASKSGFASTYLTTPTPISMDTAMVPMNMVTTSNYGTLHSLAQVTQGANTGVVAMIIVNGTTPQSPPVAGATITTSPAAMPYRYNASNGFPNKDATATAADGIAYGFNLAPGMVTVNATASGSTFRPTTLKVFADSLNQTLVITQ